VTNQRILLIIKLLELAYNLNDDEVLRATVDSVIDMLNEEIEQNKYK